MQNFPVYPILHNFTLLSSGPRSFLGAPANNRRFVIHGEPSSPACLFLGDLFQVGWWLFLGEFLVVDEGRKVSGSVSFGVGLQQLEKEKMKTQAVNAHFQNCQYHSGEISPLIKAAKGNRHQLQSALFCFFLLSLSREELKACSKSEMGKISESENVWRMRKANKVNSSELSEFDTWNFSSVLAFSGGLSVTILNL